MELYCGNDLHSNNNVNVVIDNDGKVLARKKLANDLTLVLRFLEPYKASLAGIVIESTYNWYWLVDGLMEAGYKVHLANTAAIQKYSGLKHADDKSDATWLAEMLRLNILREGFIHPKEHRAARDLMRKRRKLVEQATANLLSIQGQYQRILGYKPSSNHIKRLTEEAINERFADPNAALAIKSNLVVMKCANEQVRVIEKALHTQVKLAPEFEILKSVDGIGLILALTIMLEAGDMNRFNKAGNFASYCRCVKGAQYSNDKKKGNTNTKNGNPFLGWAFVEAANFAIRHNETVKAYYQRKMSKTCQVKAIKTVAHKLAKACFYMLRDQVAFDVKKAFC